MHVSVSTLRSELSTWLDRARSGEPVTVTDRGIPVARIVGLDEAPVLERLIREGRVTPASRPKAPAPRPIERDGAEGSVADLIIEERDRLR